MLPGDAVVVGLTIHLDTHYADLEDGMTVQLRQHYNNLREATVRVDRFHGAMADYLDTYVSEVTSAFLYGARGDVARAAQGVMKQARAHGRSHDRA